ncbi:MAG: hypothetical protein BGP02_14570 [Pandoraea sp. 64-18]|nr:MAG: hypothetical protein BGP02_14570 [Pandoraea sp. 64-18]
MLFAVRTLQRGLDYHVIVFFPPAAHNACCMAASKGIDNRLGMPGSEALRAIWRAAQRDVAPHKTN